MENISHIKLSSLEDLKSLNDYENKNIILYVYPKDNTLACSIEAREFNQLKEEFDKLDTVILGLSKDKLKSHENFRDKYNLKFNLLSDPEQLILSKLSVLKEVKNRKNPKIIRSTFIFDKNKNLVKKFFNVKATGHAKEVLAYIKENL